MDEECFDLIVADHAVVFRHLGRAIDRKEALEVLLDKIETLEEHHIKASALEEDIPSFAIALIPVYP
jgi:hypothetical protein